MYLSFDLCIFCKLEVDLDLYRYYALKVCYVSGKKSDLFEKYLVGSLKTHFSLFKELVIFLTGKSTKTPI